MAGDVLDVSCWWFATDIFRRLKRLHATAVNPRKWIAVRALAYGIAARVGADDVNRCAV